MSEISNPAQGSSPDAPQGRLQSAEANASQPARAGLREALPLRDSRIDLRVTAEQKALLEQAASLSGVSLSAYTLLHLIPKAQQDLERQQRLTLSNRDRDLFLSAIVNPPKLEGKLKTAIAKYQQKYE